MGKDIYGQIRGQRPGDVGYLGRDGAWSVDGHPINANSNGSVTIGAATLLTTSTFGVYGTKGQSYVLVDVQYVQTGNGFDSGAIRGFATQSSGSSAIRALEGQVSRLSSSSANNTWALELGVHSETAGNGTGQNVGIYLASSHSGWTPTGVRNDSGILIGGADGWTNYIYCLETDGSTARFYVDRYGQVYSSAPLDTNNQLQIRTTGTGVAYVTQVTAGGTIGLGTLANGNFSLDVSGVAAGVIGVTRASAVANSLVVATGNIRFGSGNYGVGTITSDANGNLTSVSDQRLKTHRGYVTQGHDAVMALKPRIFTWNEASGMETEHSQIGFFADEVEEVIPEAVGRNAHGDRTLNDRGLIAALINGYKEQDARIAALEAKVAELS